MAAELRHRTVHKSNGAPVLAAEDATTTSATTTTTTTTTEPNPSLKSELHPAGSIKYGRSRQILRGTLLALYFSLSCIAIVATQLVGAPLYWYDREWYYAYMAVTKQSFALLSMSITQWWGPTKIRMSGDESVAGQIHQTPDGRVEFSFPERLVLIANHQIYTDWLYLWWAGYANNPQMHGHLYIILKESLKYIPVLGWPGMLFYGFIFMSRKMSTDQPRLAHRLAKLSREHKDPRGNTYLDPMWLLLFPEGTNISGNGRVKSAKWAEKVGVRDTEHVLLPRSTGTLFCLRELKGTVEYVYDCTVAYEGVPRGSYGEQIFTIQSTYFQGRPPRSVNFYWRRFRVADIPLDSDAAFDAWLRDRWYEKDALLDGYLVNGRFPRSAEELGQGGYVETEVRTKYAGEFTRIYVVLGVVYLLWRLVARAWGIIGGV